MQCLLWTACKCTLIPISVLQAAHLRIPPGWARDVQLDASNTSWLQSLPAATQAFTASWLLQHLTTTQVSLQSPSHCEQDLLPTGPAAAAAGDALPTTAHASQAGPMEAHTTSWEDWEGSVMNQGAGRSRPASRVSVLHPEASGSSGLVADQSGLQQHSSSSSSRLRQSGGPAEWPRAQPGVGIVA